MMIESDVIYAPLKFEDWLNPAVTSLFKKIIEGKFGTVYASRESLHELYYTSMEEDVPVEDFIGRVESLTSLPNLKFLDTTFEIDILALTLMKQFKINSIFNAYYAATCLSMADDRTVISTNEVHDRVTGITRVDSRDIK